MVRFLPILLACVPLMAVAQSRDGRQFATSGGGRLVPIKEVERRVLPMMRQAQYLGFDLEQDSGVYTLKFLRNGAVIWVDVDGHSGQVIGHTGR